MEDNAKAEGSAVNEKEDSEKAGGGDGAEKGRNGGRGRETEGGRRRGQD